MQDSNEQVSSQICMKSPWDLRKYKFRISPYQRGYRWCTRQVQDLLRDLTEFAEKHSGQATTGKDTDYPMPQLMLERIPADLREPISTLYARLCRVSRSKDPVYGLQPLIVKNTTDNEWEVVDGQQRLTTLLVLLHCLGLPHYYSIRYKTMGDVENTLEELKGMEAEALEDALKQSPDKLHLYLAYQIVQKWLNTNGHRKLLVDLLQGKLPAEVKFIWYELTAGDAVKEFVNINSGKIALTKSELAKALILQRHPSMEEGQLQTIALQWEQIENALCEHDFWFFISKDTEAVLPKSNRISLVLRMAVSQLIEDRKLIDEQKLFEHVKAHFNGEGTHREKVEELWERVMSVFWVLEHWYASPELYNWVGFLIHCHKGLGLYQLYRKQAGTGADGFREVLRGEVKKRIPKKEDLSDLNYHVHAKEIRDLLLFLNIHMLNKSQTGQEDKDLGRSPVYKFPFNLYAKEAWDIEHIDSQTEDVNQFLQQTLELCEEGKLKDGLQKIKDEGKNSTVEELEQKVREFLQEKGYLDKEQDETSKDGICNLTLLSADINRSYGNVPFAMKRKVIRERIGQGKFVPICTQLAFTKSYSALPQNMMLWDASDKEAYMSFIEAQINGF